MFTSFYLDGRFSKQRQIDDSSLFLKYFYPGHEWRLMKTSKTMMKRLWPATRNQVSAYDFFTFRCALKQVTNILIHTGEVCGGAKMIMIHCGSGGGGGVQK